MKFIYILNIGIIILCLVLINKIKNIYQIKINKDNIPEILFSRKAPSKIKDPVNKNTWIIVGNQMAKTVNNILSLLPISKTTEHRVIAEMITIFKEIFSTKIATSA